ncbi:hypothetical protein [Zobellia galactanivorans]|uniref:Hypothetical periplasmic protein n=1 Tax=Zobellia galactanivorans (strain DSM 12802 / CCUG 47099 / CIP 106680 / NCIMB 13871 / Dsij) TaxID=63186 RepID=G0L798_ZOBGA|nr:hypothetical protein [Zobellia galactanivorans]MBU3027534.1 hypothetical protein [Zobellia galactanivorans]CAZ97246.1 Hypothetical periplasmic protein [Zobellia galactanivorans]
MKFSKNLIFACIITLTTYNSFAQLKILGHTHVTNTDTEAMTELGKLIVAITIRNETNENINNVLRALIEKEKQLLKSKYDVSPHDSKSGFIAKSAGTLQLSMAEQALLSKFSNERYMTENKKTLMKNMALSKSLLPFLQVLDSKNITAANRQEIYRLRSEIIRQYSNNDKQTFGLMALPAIRLAAEGDEELLKWISELEIFL